MGRQSFLTRHLRACRLTQVRDFNLPPQKVSYANNNIHVGGRKPLHFVAFLSVIYAAVCNRFFFSAHLKQFDIYFCCRAQTCQRAPLPVSPVPESTRGDFRVRPLFSSGARTFERGIAELFQMLQTVGPACLHGGVFAPTLYTSCETFGACKYSVPPKP